MPGRVKKATGKQVLSAARNHIGEKYVLGILVPKDNVRWTGPWDCAEFTSWLVFQQSGRLYGCGSNSTDPTNADAYTGYWERDASKIGRRISVEDAAGIPGAAVLRTPKPGSTGHIAISDGEGGTVEAYSSRRGVIESRISGRRWDMGILVPWVTYSEPVAGILVRKPRGVVYRWTQPTMQGTVVKEIQRALKNAGYDPGRIDGIFGKKTSVAVVAYQRAGGLLIDGEVGSRTARSLGVELT